MRRVRFGFAVLATVGALACDEPREPEIPAIVLNPTGENRDPTTENRQPKPEDRQPKTENGQPTTENQQPTTDAPELPPPWPPIDVIEGRFSPTFAREYVELTRAERAAFDAEMAKPLPPAKSPQEATHRRISEKGRRARLMNKPTLATITDDEISDVLSFNPQMTSGKEEFARLLRAHPQQLSTCVDHGRWLLHEKERQAAITEYSRCARLPGITEDQLRYVQTQITATKNMKD